MARRGNQNRKPKGIPEGGQFARTGEGFLVRPNPMESDISSYLDNRAAGNNDPVYKGERIRNINKALYDGGYAEKTGSVLNGFSSPGEAEDFIRQISTEHKTTEAWLEHRDMVETYLRVAKGYFDNNKFDLVVNGARSEDGSYRDATELMREFGIGRKEIRTELLKMTADDFVNSGANDSRYEANKGTVVMVFAPRAKLNGQEVDLYVKLVLNPHPDRSRGQTEMQVLSFKEAGNKVCLYTGKERKCRK